MQTLRKTKRVAASLIFATALIAGCLDGGSPAAFDEEPAASLTNRTDPDPVVSAQEAPAKNSSADPPRDAHGANYTSFEPVQYTWQGMAPAEACVSGACADATFALADGSESFLVTTGAVEVMILLTWSDPSGRPMTVHASGAVETIQKSGASPLEITLPILDEGDLLLLVRQYAVGEMPTYVSTAMPFSTEIAVS